MDVILAQPGYPERDMDTNPSQPNLSANPKAIHLVLISKPGLMRNSLLAYFRSLPLKNLQTTAVEPIAFLTQEMPQTPDAMIINEENDPEEIDRILQMACQIQCRSLFIVGDVSRQRDLIQVTDAPVLVWGFIRQGLEQFLLEL
jgi:hypothetical protein